ncbi:flagellar biosynthesis regulator FlaF [Hellea sp.]|nr:flagellar biosynthesis regulator FlaF [Hellea sp.]
MTNSNQAIHGYKTVQREINSDKTIELNVFISVTSALRRVDKEEIGGATKLAEALTDNAKLWKILFIDLVNPENPLPLPLKSSLMSLAKFTQIHTLQVLSGKADHQVLIDINQSIIEGLRQSAALEQAAKDTHETSRLTEVA